MTSQLRGIRFESFRAMVSALPSLKFLDVKGIKLDMPPSPYVRHCRHKQHLHHAIHRFIVFNTVLSSLFAASRSVQIPVAKVLRTVREQRGRLVRRLEAQGAEPAPVIRDHSLVRSDM
jgi:hypothetical protein